MDITISSRGAEPSEAVAQAIRNKIGRLSRFLEGMDTAEVHLCEERNPRIAERVNCEVIMRGHGNVVQCKVAAHDTFGAVDLAVEKLEHQLTKLKTKLMVRSHRG